MKGDHKYRRPPVIEALCEIFLVGSVWDDTVPGRFYDLVKDDFPIRRQQEIHEAEVMFSAEGSAAAGVRRLPPRIQFVSQREDRLIQLGQDLLVVNQLRPYPHFEQWEPVVHTAVKAYRDLAQPQGVAKLGIRYINHVAIPATGEQRISMEEYFAIYPQLPSTMGNGHGAFMVRVELPQQRGGHTVLVTFGTAPRRQPEKIAFLLDLYDIFQPATPLPFERISEEVRIAHDNVEAAFEGSITERLRQLFEPEPEQ